MAIPTAPTIPSLCTEAFIRCGIPNPTAAQLLRAEQLWFEATKRDIATRKDWHSIEETLIVIPSAYTQVYAMPSPLIGIKRIRFYRGTKTGTMVGGGTASFQIEQGRGNEEDRGRKIFLTGGTGVAQSGRITAYQGDDTYEISCPWETLPEADTTYMIADTEKMVNGNDVTIPLHGIGPSTEFTRYDFIEHTLRFWPPLDDANEYAVEIDGLVDLSLIDSQDARMVRLLREWQEPLVRGMMVFIKEDQDDPQIDRDERKFEKSTMNAMKQDVRKRLRGEAPSLKSLGGGIRRRR